MGTKEPWFKLWSADLLTDSKLDEIPLEAQGLLLRMWCVCNLRGSIPNDIEEIARLTRCKVSIVSMIVSIIVPFFELRDGNLYSNRMEREKAKSELARKSVQARIDKATSTKSLSNRSSNRSSKSPSQKARKPESQNTEEKDSLPTLSQEPEITAPKPEPKTTERDTQPRTVVMTPGRTFELSEDLTDAVLEIGLAHPKNYRFIGLPAERFPWDQTTEILDAIERDGKDAVLAGVRNLRDCFKRRPRSDLTFAPEPKKFFHESEYLKDPIEWERIDAKQFDSRTKAQRDQDATVDAPSVRNAETMLGAEFSSANISRFEIKGTYIHDSLY